ncbi:glycosyltransferase family 4 protein [Sediminibacterium goheungense]|uniref:Glycosyltransferase involved in cell wall biosynthesis n=1 Tax=Sediminibacterium goheungense TaxID=1086393 RepID=A0A4V3C499_9BACT|nr:glycosyltransferase family 4 protein [Sediminibacterium goheungense]TDO25158.1 glycosyltransferase involved in cell wall biosynthesis [Sediminibacterium goheungense]
MHILIVNNTPIPALKYGGTERVIWWLGKALAKAGHQVSYLVPHGSSCPFAKVYPFNPSLPFNEQVPKDKGIDIIHLNHTVNEEPLLPHIMTMHGNLNVQVPLPVNTVFVSGNHAARFCSDSFVHNGIDPDDYGDPALSRPRSYIHFLGDAAWRVKNVQGAIAVSRKAGLPLHVIGGYRFNFNQGIRITFDRHVRFHGMKGGEEKNELLRGSKAMLFPVRWHEPFGLALIESLYFGCPVFGTPYGSLPEIVQPGTGFLSAISGELSDALSHIDSYDKQYCHDYAMAHFSSEQMMRAYLSKYEKVMNGHTLNPHPPVLKEIQYEKFLPFE